MDLVTIKNDYFLKIHKYASNLFGTMCGSKSVFRGLKKHLKKYVAKHRAENQIFDVYEVAQVARSNLLNQMEQTINTFEMSGGIESFDDFSKTVLLRALVSANIGDRFTGGDLFVQRISAREPSMTYNCSVAQTCRDYSHRLGEFNGHFMHRTLFAKEMDPSKGDLDKWQPKKAFLSVASFKKNSVNFERICKFSFTIYFRRIHLFSKHHTMHKMTINLTLYESSPHKSELFKITSNNITRHNFIN
ncbi:hypothetical protein C1H46_024739 [Malus baccata]|uniref:Uncharacterized protein n=1 Tax=Malus baccata TaxID=106549 RepID=A0A540LTC0_MALBA|nr:hypothetical protein C1H46_024739 [Malus baccata]